MTEDSTDGFGGPDLNLQERYGRATAGPTLIALSFDDAFALRDRVIAAGTWSRLDPADQALLEQGIREVDYGLSPTLQGEVGGDWAAEDAALDANDAEDKALPADEDWVGL